MNSNDEVLLSTSRKYILLILAAVYLIVRFFLTPQLDDFGPYGSYYFEAFCVIMAIGLFGNQVFTFLTPTTAVIFGSPIAIVVGFLIFKSARLTGIQIPFEFKNKETLLFLLVIAPILEEGIFRFFLWQPIQLLSGSRLTALIITSSLFSYSHLHALWFVPFEMHNFIMYQSVYTFFLGIACGLYVYRYSSLTSAILIHFAFNLGFYLAFAM